MNKISRGHTNVQHFYRSKKNSLKILTNTNVIGDFRYFKPYQDVITVRKKCPKLNFECSAD